MSEKEFYKDMKNMFHGLIKKARKEKNKLWTDYWKSKRKEILEKIKE